MISKLEKDELYKLENSFIDVDKIKEDFHNNPYAQILIYTEDNKVIGYLYYSEIYERIEINQFEILTSHRNCGKGNELLRELINSTNKSITLEVKETNAPAISLYKKNGFESVAKRKNYYNGIDGILMERKQDSC